LLGSPALGSGPWAAERLATLQDRNIFRSGLIGTHTVALTFDDGPNTHTAEVLDVLKANQVAATFFVVGRMGVLHPKLLARIADEGHLLANHSASHQAFDAEYAEDPGLLLDELRVVDDQIRPLMPDGTRLFFRAPYGIWRPEYANLLNADPVLKRYVGPVYWDEGGEIAFDSDGALLSAADWQCWKLGWAAADCAAGYLNEIRDKNGGVVLLHCIHSQSAGLVDALVPVLLNEGFDFVRLDQVSDYREYETPAPQTAVAFAARASRSAFAN
jgi:peptidoglycan/xylan/chitin deacetylase (PgdA/CDA1 family)